MENFDRMGQLLAVDPADAAWQPRINELLKGAGHDAMTLPLVWQPTSPALDTTDRQSTAPTSEETT